MPRSIQDPVVTQEGPDHRRETVSRHPAYGQISVGRVSGSTMLYGSDFTHHNFIRIEIKHSSVSRAHSNDHYYASGTIAELDLSESQWATMVSSLNVGMGVPCTLTQLGGTMVPGLPYPPKKAEMFANEASKTLERAAKYIDDLTAQINDSKLSQKGKDELLSTLRMVRMNIEGNVDFVLKQFGEHMEDITEKAKIEINAYGNHLLMQTGLNALADPGHAKKLLGFEPDGKDDTDVN